MDAGTSLMFATAGAGAVVGSYAIYLGKKESNDGHFACGGLMLLGALVCVLFALDDLGVINFL